MPICEITIHVAETMDTEHRLLAVAFDHEQARISALLGEVTAAGDRAQPLGV